MNPADPTPSDPTALRTAPDGGAVAGVYAEALFELAAEKQQLDETGDEVAQLRRLIHDNADLRRLLTHPVLDSTQRAGMLQRLFEGRVNDLLYRFLQTLSRKGRLAALPAVAVAFAARLAAHRNELAVEAHVARPLDDATAGRVADGLGAALGKTVTLTQTVDPSLLGGLKLRIGDRLLDATVARQLKNIEQQLTAAGREKARALANA
ncbi:MAG: ATP synthase F1 subunit delta [Planctomycetota bacterium]